MPTRPLRIAWLGPGPGEDGGVSGVVTDLLAGLVKQGHRIDCFLPGKKRALSPRLTDEANLTFIWGTSTWKWDRWYSRAKVAAFASGLVARALAAVRLRQEISRRHRSEPYDLVYQFSTIENLAVPARVARTVPLVIHPETHIAGELRFLLAERRLSRRCQPRHVFALVAAIMFVRMLAQRVRIRRASLLICISGVFRDHIVADYGFPRSDTVVIPNPVRVDRFPAVRKSMGDPPTVLVLGRIAARKGVEDVVGVAQLLRRRGAAVRFRVVGGPSLWSDYTKLLEDLPSENAEYVGSRPASEIPAELAGSDLLLQASKYEPFALTVGEALAAGVPVIGTTEVGAIESVDRTVAAAVAPGDVEAMASEIVRMLDRVRENPAQMSALARAEAERLFAPEIVCEQISAALQRLVGDDRRV
ncbi:MAG TPA: glycosyltransferase family 4 protein [Solirubrobacteraceae bacterium]|jgi:glycosyltransferase involved in cell wall biosynthesis|nr:glycosyltransferase family 4 protein [Solirubrobacteraceae bacterium]